MWDALQQQSFLVGAALILIYQAARFGDIYAEILSRAATSRYSPALAFVTLQGPMPTTGRSLRSLSRALSFIRCFV